MSATCTHLDSIELTELPEAIAGREDCLAIGGAWGTCACARAAAESDAASAQAGFPKHKLADSSAVANTTVRNNLNGISHLRGS